MKLIIEVKDLVKKYKKSTVNAVDHISFNVEEGEFFAFLGPNGAGKTTTISILTTILSKTAGEVKIVGYDIEKNQNEVRQRVGIIFQNPSLDRNLTAEENIRLHAILYGLYSYRPSYHFMPDSYKKRVLELSDLMDLKKDIFKPINTFSGGMKRKLEIIRGLMHQPKILFLDEPTLGLDPVSRRALWEYLKEVRKKSKTTIFLTTHYLDEAEDTDHTAIINFGKIVEFGTPSQIKKKLVKEYLVVDAIDRKKLKEELKEKRIKFYEADGLRVDVKQEHIKETLDRIKTPLSVVKTHVPSLEDAYLEVVKTE
mgnify:CR=1 FL=1